MNEVDRLSNSADEQKRQFSAWAMENLGEQIGMEYSPYIEKFGSLLRQSGLDNEKNFYENFFYYRSFEEFKEIYQQIMNFQHDEDIFKILKGGKVNYPDSYPNKNLVWKQTCAQFFYDKGEIKSLGDISEISGLYSVLTSYLKFLYYAENPSLIYPKRKKKTSTYGGNIDDSINYWLYAPGKDARLWEDFYKSGVIGLGWDFLGDLEQYQNRLEVEKAIAEDRNDGIRPNNDSKAVWEFYQEIKPGDIVFVKSGRRKVIGRGIVTGEYYFDEQALEYKHRHKIDWINKGNWELKEQVSMKTLTNINSSSDSIVYMNQLMSDEPMEQDTLLINEFKNWLSQQVQQNGDYLSYKTINQKTAALSDIQNFFHVTIFGETDTEILKNIKEEVLTNENYDRYKGVVVSSIDYYIRYVESRPTVEENDPYSLDDFLEEVFIDQRQTDQLQSVLRNKNNLILKGAPGVGKTFIADRLAYLMMKEKDDSRIQMIQFHQSYSYEDLIEGYRPKAEGEGFELKQGPFVKFSRKAERDPEREYFFIIDEINRGNMSKIFGELLMLIEADKRGKSINLLYSNEKFSVPSNLYIIGMMNTADRSLALLDYALRRRFSFFEISPAFDNNTFLAYLEKLGNPEKLVKVIEVVKHMNNMISEELGTGFQIGHSYFVGGTFEFNPDDRLKEVVEFEIIPQLYEYWFDDEEKAEEWANKLRGAYGD